MTTGHLDEAPDFRPVAERVARAEVELDRVYGAYRAVRDRFQTDLDEAPIVELRTGWLWLCAFAVRLGILAALRDRIAP